MRRTRVISVVATIGVLAATGSARAAEPTPVSPWAVGQQMQWVDDVTWDATGDTLLISGNPAGDDTCCTHGLWLARADGSGTRLDGGGAEIRGAAISPDGRTMAWIEPAQVERQTRVVVRDAAGTTTVTRLPNVGRSYEPLYGDTLVGATGRVFAIMSTSYGTYIVAIPRGGRGHMLPRQPSPSQDFLGDAPGERAVLSPDGRIIARCARLNGRNVAGVLDPATGRLRSHRVRRGYLMFCGVTDGGTVATIVMWPDRRSGRMLSRLELVSPGGRSRGYRVGVRDRILVGPHAVLVGHSGSLLTAPESGGRPRRIPTPRGFRLDVDNNASGWSADGRLAAIPYASRRGPHAVCHPLDRLLVVDVRRRRTLRRLTKLPGAVERQGIRDSRVTSDGMHVLFSTAHSCARRSHGWAVGTRSGSPVDLNGAGFAYMGMWDPPGPGVLVAQDRSQNGSSASAVGLVRTTAQLGTGPLAMPAG